MSLEIFYGIGAVLLLGGIVYGTIRWHGRNRRLDALGDAASRRIYEREDEKSKQRSTPAS
ncbi:MAG TPA: hypothetical protein VMH86_09590 [Rhizomicrobium sp.]|nr:hypothetical protein [Rhizomicrobium sp.]